MGFVHTVLSYLARKVAPSTSVYSNLGFVDEYHRMPEPTKRALLEQYKQTVYTCAMMNAVGVASQTLRLYATTGPGETSVKRFSTRKLKQSERKELLHTNPQLYKMAHVRKALEIEEITQHPAIDLLDNPNEYFDGFTMIEMTDLLGEITGVGYWQLIRGLMDRPTQLWLLPTQLVTPIKHADGYVSYYSVNSTQSIRVEVKDMIPFSFPNLVDPYSPEGVSPLRAYFETAKLTSKLMAYNHSLMDNRARPEVLLLPKDQIGDAEADRLEKKFMRKFRRGGAGGAMVMDSAMKAELLQYSNRDLEMLALCGATKEDICNAYDVPFSMVNIKDSNRATSEAGHYQHARNAIWPRCRRMESKLNKFLAPMFDERLFFAFDCPVPSDIQNKMAVREKNLALGVTVINEERADDGLPPVDWGDRPILPMNMMPLTEDDVNGKGMRGAAQTAPSKVDPKKPAADPKNDAAAQTNTPGKTGSLRRAHLSHREKCGLITDATWAKRSAGRAPGSGHSRALPDGKQLAVVLQKTFDRQRRDLIGTMTSTQHVASVKFDPADWTRSLAQEVIPVLADYYDEGAKDARERHNISEAKAFSDKASIMSAIQDAAMKLSQSVNETTSLEVDEAIARMHDAIQEGVAFGDSSEELTKSINAIFDRATESRARMIARTESARAIHMGQLMQIEEAGLKAKLFWELAESPCPICIAIAESTKNGVDLGKSFAILGDANPAYAEVLCPPAHPNCQCTMTEVVESKE